MEAAKISEAVERALVRAFPDRAEDELAKLARLPPSRQLKAADRLNALRIWLGPDERIFADEERFANVAEAAEAAGLTLNQFYRLLKAWESDPSVRALGVRADAPLKRPDLALASRAEVDRVLDHMLSRNPAQQGFELVDAVERLELAQPPSATTLARWIQEARRRNVSTFSLGFSIVFDSAVLDAVAADGERVRLYAAVDQPNGYVYGWYVDVAGVFSVGYARAARAADSVSAIPPRVSTFLVPGLQLVLDDDDPARGRLLSVTSRIRSVGPEVLGRHLVRLLGERVGPLRIGVGKPTGNTTHRSGREAALPIFGDSLRSSLAEAIEAHNERILKRIRTYCPPAAGGTEGIEAVLATVAGLEDRIMELYRREADREEGSS